MQSRHCVSASPTTNERTHTYLRNSSTERRECKPGGQPHAPRTFEHARRSELSRDAPCGPLFAAPAVSPARTATSLTHSSAWQHQCGRKDWHCHATLHAGHCSPRPRCRKQAQPRRSLPRLHGNINVGEWIGGSTFCARACAPLLSTDFARTYVRMWGRRPVGRRLKQRDGGACVRTCGHRPAQTSWLGDSRRLTHRTPRRSPVQATRRGRHMREPPSSNQVAPSQSETRAPHSDPNIKTFACMLENEHNYARMKLARM